MQLMQCSYTCLYSTSGEGGSMTLNSSYVADNPSSGADDQMSSLQDFGMG